MVYVIDESTIFIKGFSYDGTAPDVFFWVGNTTAPSPMGEIVPYPEDYTGRYVNTSKLLFIIIMKIWTNINLNNWKNYYVDIYKGNRFPSLATKLISISRSFSKHSRDLWGTRQFSFCGK